MTTRKMKFEWLSPKENDKISHELDYLDSVDPITGHWRDTQWMSFKPQVVDKYRNNNLVEIAVNHINFLNRDGGLECSVCYRPTKRKLMVQAREFCFVPEKERTHWLHFIIRDINKKFK